MTSLFLLCLTIIAHVSAENYPRKLTKHLLIHYQRLGIPSKNSSTATAATLGFTLLKLDLAIKQNRLDTVVWPKIGWQDDFLTWDPSEWGGVIQIRLPIDKIWAPDFTLFNSESGHSLITAFVPTLPSEAIVYNTGYVFFVAQLNLRSICNANQSNGPQSPVVKRLFGASEVSCNMKFGSWTYNGRELDVKNTAEKPDLSEYTENPCWKIVDAKVSRHEKLYACCPEPYISIEMNIDLKKNAMC